MERPVPEFHSADLLLEAVGFGSEAALRRLYESEGPRLYSLALNILRSPDAANDALQDAFIQIWQKARLYAPERGSAAAWMATIVRFRALDILRKSKWERPTDDPSLGDDVVHPDIVERLDLQAAAGSLSRCLALLDAVQRDYIMLSFTEGLSHGDLARKMSLPIGTIKGRIRRALATLRECLQ